MSDDREFPRAWQVFASVVVVVAALIAVATGLEHFKLWPFNQAEQPHASSPASQQAAGAPGQVQLSGVGDLPDWLLVAHQRDCTSGPAPECVGDVFFNQRTITRNADGTADIWIQVRHAQPQFFVTEDNHARTTVQFNVERIHYRFNCAAQQFTMIERQIMGAGDTVVAHDEPPQIFRAPGDGSVTPILMPIACRGS